MDKMGKTLLAVAQVVGVVVLAEALVGGAYFFGIPSVLEPAGQLSARRDALKTKVNTMKADNDFADEVLRNHTEYEARVESLKQQRDALREIIPDEQASVRFKKVVEKDSAAAGTHLLNLDAQPWIDRDFFSEVPFQGRVQGRYSSIVAFLDRLDREPQISSVSRFFLYSQDAGKPSNGGIRPDVPVDTRFTVTTYVNAPFHNGAK